MNRRFPQLCEDAPPVPLGKRPRDGVDYGCGKDSCGLCYQEENPRQPGDDDGVEYADPRDERDERRRS